MEIPEATDRKLPIKWRLDQWKNQPCVEQTTTTDRRPSVKTMTENVLSYILEEPEPFIPAEENLYQRIYRKVNRLVNWRQVSRHWKTDTDGSNPSILI